MKNHIVNEDNDIRFCVVLDYIDPMGNDYYKVEPYIYLASYVIEDENRIRHILVDSLTSLVVYHSDDELTFTDYKKALAKAKQLNSSNWR